MKLRVKKGQYPEGSVKDAQRYTGNLADYIQAEEDWLAAQAKDFGLYGLDPERLLVPAIFTMVEVVQPKHISGPDFFGEGIFVQYDDVPEDGSFPGGGASHHSGWRLLMEADKPRSVVILSPSNPKFQVEFLVEGEPPEAWVENVIKTYYVARRASVVAQSEFQARFLMEHEI